MSAGCLILAAGEHGHRCMGPNARLMYHQGYEIQGGDLVDQKNNLREFQRTEKQYDRLVAKETSRTLKEVEALYNVTRTDRYMTAREALAFGFIDGIAGR